MGITYILPFSPAEEHTAGPGEGDENEIFLNK